MPVDLDTSNAALPAWDCSAIRPHTVALGRAEGQSPSAFLVIPHDWGIKGVETEFMRHDPSLDSRLRGNDRLGAAGCCRGFGGVLGSRAGLVSPVPPIGASRGAQPLCVSCDPPRVGARGLTGLRRTLRLPRLLLAWLGEWLAMTTIVAQAMALLIFLTARTTMATSTTSSPTRTNTLAAISDHPPPCWLIRTTGSTR